MKNKEFKPVIICDNYERVDGQRAYNSDVKELELGFRKDEDTNKLELLARILKEEGNFEDMPINRAIDLVILMCEASLHFREAYRMPKLYNEENPIINRVAMQGDAMNITVCKDNEDLDKDIFTFSDELNRQGELLGERFRVLARTLEELGY
ncbi:hypothetical protein CHL78_009870 [Romboutsia weinsteinii]|uniref:Uncharacterized protein n=1 Tax=Romboutsia weinsteinii TaxID=2020949 RepID=A0A371J3M7_9FIRM|nr:DUF6530 family protein [Romboutsia weinsteinii]RDY27284.1 hypothetical protein CHL78_009870 [Romboutsia weinsteinii]